MRDVRVFLIASAVWIVATHLLALRIADGDAVLLGRLEIVKGTLYIAFCTLALWWVRRREGDRYRAMSEQSAKLAAIVTSSRDAIVSADAAGRILTWNPSAERLYGRSAADAVGRGVEILVREEDQPALRDALARTVSGAASGASVEPLRARVDVGDGGVSDGGTAREPLRELVLSLAPIRAEDGGVAGTCAIVRDVTARVRAEERYRAVVESSLGGFFWWEEDGRITEANDQFLALLGYAREDLAQGRLRWDDLTPPEHRDADRERLGQLRTSGRVEPYRKEFLRKDGARVPVLVGATTARSSGPLRGVAFVTDLTEQREMEAALRRAEERATASQRMEAVGRVAGGIAHDFNNLLTVVIGYAELAQARTPAEDPRHKALEHIRAAGDKAAELTQNLLAFSRRQVLEPVDLDVNAVLAEMRVMVARIMGEDCTVEFLPAPDLPKVRADRARLEQAWLNLVLNARDAMPRGGRLTVSTRVLRTERGPGESGDPPAGTYVEIAFADTGVGMSDAVKRRVFEPYFTTKERNQGAGLGLATVYGTVRQSGGVVMFESVEGRGTTFRIRLPAVEGEPAPRPAAAPRSAAEPGDATVLLVEDSEHVRLLAARILEDKGYRVLSAADGREAVAAAERHAGRIDALVTDLVMPEMTGREVAERLRAARPGIGVLFVSGYTEDEIVLRGLSPGEGRFLRKPYRPDALAGAVQDVLDAARSA